MSCPCFSCKEAMSHTTTKCPYCFKMMQEIYSEPGWQECRTCSFLYTHDFNGLHQTFICRVGDLVCYLNLYPDIEKSVLRVDKEPIYSNLINNLTEIRINHCMKNITPQNVIDKIKLILLYQ